jgi:hypothetical protein
MADTHMGLLLRQIRKLVAAPADAPPSDGDLLERFAARREETAFAELVRRHGPRSCQLASCGANSGP